MMRASQYRGIVWDLRQQSMCETKRLDAISLNNFIVAEILKDTVSMASE